MIKPVNPVKSVIPTAPSQSPLPPCRLPSPLQPGDELWVVTPCGALRDLEVFWRGVDIWRSRGYEIKLSRGFDTRWGYLAGQDAQRRTQLLEALADSRCRGLLCARGGFGSTRLLEDWSWPQGEPRWLIGFSDVTGLLWSLARSGISGVHGPVLTTLTSEPDWSLERLFRWLEQHQLPPLTGKGWVGGRVEGLLLPGNLTVATHLLHTQHQPALHGTILALEDVSEAPYRLDRLLTYWRTTGILNQVVGIALGRFSRCDPPSHFPSFSIEEVLRDRLGDLGIPIVADLPFGHDGPNGALPVGVPAYLDGDQGVLGITQV